MKAPSSTNTLLTNVLVTPASSRASSRHPSSNGSVESARPAAAPRFVPSSSLVRTSFLHLLLAITVLLMLSLTLAAHIALTPRQTSQHTAPTPTATYGWFTARILSVFSSNHLPSWGAARTQLPARPPLPAMTPAQISALIQQPPHRYGAQEKAGELPAERWAPVLGAKLQERFDAWLQGATVLEGGHGPPPQAAPCTVLINDAYKMIFVKNTKAAGTSAFLFFGGGYCPGMVDGYPLPDESGEIQNPRACFRRPPMSDPAALRALWREYTVFTIGRNPFDRAGSSFDYITGRRKNPSRLCDPPSFRQWTRAPYALGMQDRMFDCTHESVHDFYHVEPQAQCLTTADGASAVDFIVRYEALEVDFAELMDLLNSRRSPELPPLNGTLNWLQKGPRAAGRRTLKTLPSPPHALLPNGADFGSALQTPAPPARSSPPWNAHAASKHSTPRSDKPLDAQRPSRPLTKTESDLDMSRYDSDYSGSALAGRVSVGVGLGDAALRSASFPAAGERHPERAMLQYDAKPPPPPPPSQHVAKFVKCGLPCVRNLVQYYAQDFAFLGYPTYVVGAAQR